MKNNEFEYKNLLEIKKMSLEELSKYYRALRSYEFDNNIELKSNEIKKRIYFLTKLILKIDRITTGRKLNIYGDKRSNNIDKGKVYASSHVGRYDIESAMEAINEQVYFVMGDPEETYRNFEGFFLEHIQGRVCMDTGYQIADIFKKVQDGIELTNEELALYKEFKKDRHICESVCTKRISNKENILIYPEGAWNITPRIVQSLFKGAARIAINGNGVIVPIGIVRDKLNYTVNIGSEFDVSGAQVSDAEDITNELKEKISSLVGEIIFNESKILKRNELGTPIKNEIDFINDIMSETTNGYTKEVIENTRYNDPLYPENVLKKIKAL